MNASDDGPPKTSHNWINIQISLMIQDFM